MDRTPLPAQSLPARKRLFSPPQVLVATLLGSVLGGTVLSMITLRRLGRRRDAWVLLIIGIAATIVLLGLAWVIPEDAPKWVGVLALAPCNLVAYYGLKYAMGPALTEESTCKGVQASWWAVIGVSLVSSVIFVLLWWPTDWLGRHAVVAMETVTLESGDRILVLDESMRPAVPRVAEALTHVGYFGRGRSISIGLERDQGRPVLVFALKECTNAEVGDLFLRLGRRVSAEAFDGREIVIRLVDDHGRTKAQLRIEPKIVGAGASTEAP